jgi:hypothetical protein
MALTVMAAIALGAFGPLLAAEPASAQLKAAQLLDVGPNHWAYGAIQALVDKYRVMGGYPDKTFRGQRPVTRFELAAALVNVMDRMEDLAQQPGRVTNQDKATLDRLKAEFATELVTLNQRVTSLESSVKGLEGEVKSLKSSIGNMGNNGGKVRGGVGLTILDDPEDRLKPYVRTNFYANFSGSLEDGTAYAASISGANSSPNNGSGATPVISRQSPTQKGAPPTGGVSLGGTVSMTTKHPHLGAMNVKVGRFAMGSLMSTGGYAAHWGDGIMGSGLKEPGAATVRGGTEVGFGTSLKLGQIGLAAAVNTIYLYGGASYDFGLGTVELLADVDHNSIGAVELTGDPAYNLTAALNFGSDQLGLSLQGALAKDVPYMAAMLTSNVFGAELSGGFYTNSDPSQGIMEFVPAAYAFYPKLPFVGWSMLVAAVEPQTISTPDGTPGPGSLMGTKAGVTVQLGIPNPFIPNLVVEFDRMSDTLTGNYDGMGYAITSTVNF